MSSDYSPVPELNLLKRFQDSVGYGQYADGFGLTEYGDPSGLAAGWSESPEFLARLVPFAAATDGGSFYAFWRVDDRPVGATLPVVVFGDEGGQHVVGRDLPDLLRLIGYDAEVTVDFDDAYYYRGQHHQHRDAHPEYVAWLQEHFGLAPADDPDAIVAAARTEYGERFATWAAAHLD